MQPIDDIINYSTSFRSFESGKFGKEENEKSFFDETKNIFIVFEGLSFGEKIKIW